MSVITKDEKESMPIYVWKVQKAIRYFRRPQLLSVSCPSRFGLWTLKKWCLAVFVSLRSLPVALRELTTLVLCLSSWTQWRCMRCASWSSRAATSQPNRSRPPRWASFACKKKQQQQTEFALEMKFYLAFFSELLYMIMVTNTAQRKDVIGIFLRCDMNSAPAAALEKCPRCGHHSRTLIFQCQAGVQFLLWSWRSATESFSLQTAGLVSGFLQSPRRKTEQTLLTFCVNGVLRQFFILL